MFHFIGIDVSKATLQVYIPLTDENITLNNDMKSMKVLYSKLKKRYKKESTQLVLIFEATGSYSVMLEHFCAKQHIFAKVINPRQSANFAKALDNRSKSDIIDAKMLYQFHILLQEDGIQVPVINENKERLGEMLSYYRLLKKQRTALLNHFEALDSKGTSSFVKKDLKKEITKLLNKEESLIQEMLQIIKSDAFLEERFTNMKSFKGIGDLSAIALIYLFISYPEANRRQITALSGLDATEMSSGTSLQGRSRISKRGNALYRALLFMPVLSTVRHNPYMKAFCNRLKNNGKHTTTAQIAVMRKTILIAHALFKNNQAFDSSLYEKQIGWKESYEKSA